MNLVWSVIVIAAVAALAVTAMLLVRRNAPEGSRFQRRRPGLRRLRSAGDRVLGAARVRRLPRLRELRPVEIGGGEGGARALATGRDRTVPARPGRHQAHGRAGLLRALGDPHRMAARGVGRPGRCDQPVGRHAVPARSSPFSPRRRARRRRTASGSIRPRTARRRGSTGSTEPWASSRRRCGWCCSSSPASSSCSCCSSPTAAEGAVTQAVLMGSVAIVVASMLLLIAFLDSPFQDGVGGVRPVAMERTLRIIDAGAAGRRWNRAAAV